MRSWTFLSLLGSAIAVFQLVDADCNLAGGKFNTPFPDVEGEGIESYQMNAEYTVPGAKQTDYYTEYYDTASRRGRVDSRQDGSAMTYLYRTKTWEAWEITNEKCALKNITETPEMFKDLQTDWLYLPGEKSNLRTIGPSAMFKNAFLVWNASSKAKTMAYMGKTEGTVRGLKAHYWRRCDGDRYIDYFFSTDEEDNAFGMPIKRIPLRVFFGPTKVGIDEALSIQQYEIMVFRPFIPLDLRPFDLPVARGCRRGSVEDRPELPDFSNKNLMFSAEVIYRKIQKSGEGTQYWSYFSTLRMALDVGSQFVSYYYTPWDDSSSTDEPEVLPPERIIYDMRHGYAYKTSMSDGKCQIIREKTFAPQYKLPNNAGSVSLTDLSMLYPNAELNYLSQGINRGLKVNIFEQEVEGYILDKGNDKIQIPKAVITHSYLQKDELSAKGSVRNALTQIQLRFTGRETDVTEILIFNFFGFSTVLRGRRDLFNIQNCFENEEDYVWATIVFNADNVTLDKLKIDIPTIRVQILSAIKGQSELNAVRIPVIEVDFKDDGLYATLMILGKPPVKLDFLEPEEGMAIIDAPSGSSGGLTDADACANNCLEEQTNCWAFSICGAVCTYATNTVSLETTAPTPVGKVAKKEGCKLYRRYNNDTFIQSREGVVKDLRSEVSNNRIILSLEGTDKIRYQLPATAVSFAEPDEDDRLFDRLGNNLNPRLRPLKAGYKLKKTSGSAVKNLGKLRYDECQRICLDFKDCETVSYCLKGSECLLTGTFGDDLKAEDMEEDNMCTIVTRNYVDNFVRSPGVVLSLTAQDVLDVRTDEKCARACLTQTKYQCLSFDHCQGAGISECRLHTVHYPNSKTREAIQTKYTNCGHYYRKFSTEFKKNPDKRTIGSKVPSISNLTLEECSKTCVDYGKGTCYGFDFCQDKTILATSCTLLDSDPSQMKTTYSPICTVFFRTDSQSAPRPYTNGYAGGIGFLCFLVGGLIGAVIVFGIAYFKVNRR